MKSQFLTELEVKEVEEGRWKLLAPLKYYSDILGKVIEVGAGEETDFASVPRVPIAYMAYGDRAHRESVIHDYLYRTHLVTRSVADSIFLEAMKSRKKPLWVRWGMFLGVRVGGWVAWGRYRKSEKV